MGKNVHVTPHPGGGWQVKGAGNEKATKVAGWRLRSKFTSVSVAKFTTLNDLLLGDVI